jgi:FtsH-binding integral membrane protein
MKKWGTLLLAIWLVVSGLVDLTGLSFAGLGIVLALLAIAAGVLLVIEGRPRRLTQNLGILLLAIWLILSGVIALLEFSFPASGTLMALLAIAAGVVLILRH